MNSDNSNDTKGINAMMIIEVLGRPKEHLTETLNDIVKQIDEEKGVSVKEKRLKEPELMKDQKDFYTSFVDIEIEVDEILKLVILMFKYMPAHIEIIQPELVALTNTSWNDVLNELSRRLHGYDEMARIVQVEKDILEKKLREVLEGGNIGIKKKPAKKTPVKKKTPKKKVSKK